MANKTLDEFWAADPTLFNGLVLPTGLTASVLTNIIEDNSGRLCTYIQTGSRLKAEITNWSTYIFFLCTRCCGYDCESGSEEFECLFHT